MSAKTKHKVVAKRLGKLPAKREIKVEKTVPAKVEVKVEPKPAPKPEPKSESKPAPSWAELRGLVPMAEIRPAGPKLDDATLEHCAQLAESYVNRQATSHTPRDLLAFELATAFRGLKKS